MANLMMFRQDRRLRTIAVATTLSIILCLGNAVLADYWAGGARTTGTPTNGYFITPSAEAYSLDNMFASSIAEWIGKSTHVTSYLVRHSSSVDGLDKCYVGNRYMIGTVGSLRMIGFTRFYDKRQYFSGDLYQSGDIYPDVKNGVVLHGNGCFHDANWKMCTISIYSDATKFWADNDGVTYSDAVKEAMVHEIGHSLKLGHPPSPQTDPFDTGTQDGHNINIPRGQSSVMRSESSNPRILAPTQYDKQQLQAKWGM